MIERLVDFVFGYDFFISYRWCDGRSYALALARELKSLGFACFLDSEDYPLGANWRFEGQRALRKSAKLILVGTPDVLESDPVYEETHFFLGRKAAAVQAIDIGATLFSHPEHRLVTLIGGRQTIWGKEPITAVQAPTPEIVAQLSRSFKLTSQARWRSRLMKGALAILLGLACGLGYLSWQSEQRRQEAEGNSRRADKNAEESKKQERIALAEKLNAQNSEAHGWLLQAQTQKSQFPDRAFYAARALAFDRLGRETSSEKFKSQYPALPTPILKRDFQNACLREVQDVILPLWSTHSTCAHPKLTALAADRRGSWVATGSEEGSIRIWERVSGKLLREIDAHTGQVTQLLESMATGELISASTDSRVKVWDAGTGKCNLTFQAGDSFVNAIALSPDGTSLYTGSASGKIQSWDIKTGRLTAQLRDGPGTILSLAISRDGHLLSVSFGNDFQNPEANKLCTTIEIWDLSVSRLSGRLDGHSDIVWDTKFTSAGTRLISGSRDKTIRIWDIGARSLVRTLTADWPVRCLGVSEDGNVLLTGGVHGQVLLWDEATGRKLMQPPGHNTIIQGVAFTEGDRSFISADRSGRVCSNSVKENVPKIASPGHAEKVSWVAAIDASDTIASGSMDGTIGLWRRRDGSSGGTLAFGESVMDALLTGDQRSLWILTAEALQEWSVDGRQKSAEIPAAELGLQACHSFSVSSSGRWLACGGETGDHRYVIVLYDRGARKVQRIFAGHTNQVVALCFLGVDKLFSASYDRSIRVWKLSDERAPGNFSTLEDYPQSLRIDPAGRYLAAAAGSKVYLWNMEGRQLEELDFEQGGIATLAVDSTGRYLACGTYDGTIVIADREHPKHPRQISADFTAITALAFGKAGEFLISGSQDGAVKLWDLQNHALEKVIQLDRVTNDYAFRYKSSLIVAAGEGGKIDVWSAVTGAHLEQFEIGQAIQRIASTDDAKLIATAGTENSVRIWQTHPLSLQRTIATDYPVRKLAFSDDEKCMQIITGATASIYETAGWKRVNGMKQGPGFFLDMDFGANNRVSAASVQSLMLYPGYIAIFGLYDKGGARTLKLKSESRVQSLSIAKTAGRIAFVNEGQVEVWDLQALTRVDSLRDPSATRVAISPQGDRIAYATRDKWVRVWSVGQKEIEMSLEGNSGDVAYLAFSLGGMQIVAGDTDRQVRVWNINLRRPNLARYFDEGAYEFEAGSGKVRPCTHPVCLYGD